MRRFAALGVTTLALLASVVVLAPASALAAGAPTASTGASSSITDTQASLAGTVNPQGQLTSYAFQYGTTTGYGQQTALTSAGSGTADAPVTADLSGLTPGTVYHYRVIATNPTGTTVGDDKTFTTTGTAPPQAPQPNATTGSATTTGGSANVNGSVNPNGLATSYYFEFGTTANYGQQTPPQSAGAGTGAVSVAATLSGLQANTTYHYRVVAVGPGSAFALGADKTFTIAGSASTRLGLFGHTAFSDQHGVAGVFIACFGSTNCTGSLTLTRSGKPIGVRSKYTLRPDDGGFVHITLNDLGQRLMRSRGTMNVAAAVANANGQKTSATLKLIRYSTRGLKN